MTHLPPDKLYKYRPLDTNTLRMLCKNEVFYADPTNFNDPLDCNPKVVFDIEASMLEQLCNEMILANLGEDEFKKHLIWREDIVNSWKNFDLKKEDQQSEAEFRNESLEREVEEQLRIAMRTYGIVSMSTTWECPLLWSHYGNQHKGLCLEYDISQNIGTLPYKVKYGEPRIIKATQLVDWFVNKNSSSSNEVKEIYFLHKIKAWEYEKEWRYCEEVHFDGKMRNFIRTVSSRTSLSAIYFGLRTDAIERACVLKILDPNKQGLKFYQIETDSEGLNLTRSEFDKKKIDDIKSTIPHESFLVQYGRSIARPAPIRPN